MGYYNDTYNKVKKWHFAHENPKTEKDWEKIVDEMGQFTEPFEIALIVAVVGELERIYKELKLNEK